MISIKNFNKSFGSKQVIHDLSFDVKEGEIFAFLGANGSGKTTTIRCLLNIYTADSGELLVKGEKYGPEMSNLLGYLPEERGLYLSSQVLETMVYFGELKGLTKSVAKKRSMEYLEQIELADKVKSKISSLSSGQQQKIQLGITVLNNPKLLILDEPTKGLDPVNRGLLMDMLLKLNKSGSTIIFSTHQMEEAEKIADRLIMIKDGKKALYGEVDEVKAQFGTNTIHMKFKGDIPKNEKLYDFKTENTTAEITPRDDVTPEEVLKYLINNDIQIKQFSIASPSLNEIFIKVSNE